MKRRLVRAGLWLAAIGLLLWTLRDVAWRDTVEAVGKLSGRDWIVLVAMNGAALVVFTLRWWWILKGLEHPVSLRRASAYRLASFGLSYFTPGPQFGGEPLQVLLVERREGLPRGAAIASVALDRLVELTVSFAYLAGALLWLVRPGPFVVLGLAPLLYLVALAAGLRPASRLLGFEIVQSTELAAVDFCRRRPLYLGLALFASLLSLGVMLAEYWLMAHFLGMTLSLRGLVLGLTAARIAYLLFFPAALGVFEAGQVAAVTALGFPPALGVGLSLLVRARDVLLGALGLIWGLRTLSRGAIIRV